LTHARFPLAAIIFCSSCYTPALHLGGVQRFFRFRSYITAAAAAELSAEISISKHTTVQNETHRCEESCTRHTDW
jgi:hypothetical protein